MPRSDSLICHLENYVSFIPERLDMFRIQKLTIAHLDHMFVLVVKVEADVATITVKKRR